MDIDGLFSGWAARAQERVDQAGKPVCLADNNVSVFTQLGVIELALQ